MSSKLKTIQSIPSITLYIWQMVKNIVFVTVYWGTWSHEKKKYIFTFLLCITTISDIIGKVLFFKLPRECLSFHLHSCIRLEKVECRRKINHFHSIKRALSMLLQICVQGLYSHSLYWFASWTKGWTKFETTIPKLLCVIKRKNWLKSIAGGLFARIAEQHRSRDMGSGQCKAIYRGWTEELLIW